MRPVNLAGSPVQRASAASAIVSRGSNITPSTHPAATSDGVAMAPCGARALTAMPWPSHSLATDTVSRFRAALVAPYIAPALEGLLVGNGGPGGSSAENVVMFRIAPCPRSRIPPITSAVSSHGAHRFTCRARSRRPAGTDSNDP